LWRKQTDETLIIWPLISRIKRSCDSRESRNDLILMSAIIFPGIIGDSPGFSFTRENPMILGIAVFRCVPGGSTMKKTKWSEEKKIGRRVRTREKETETTVECLLSTYRAVTECKGRKEGSTVSRSEKIAGRRGEWRERWRD